MQGSRTLTIAIERNLHSNCSTQIPVMNHSWRVRYFVAYAPFPILCKFSPFFSLFCMFVIKIPTDNAEQTKSMIIKDLCFCGYWVCSLHAIIFSSKTSKDKKSYSWVCLLLISKKGPLELFLYLTQEIKKMFLKYTNYTWFIENLSNYTFNEGRKIVNFSSGKHY